MTITEKISNLTILDFFEKFRTIMTGMLPRDASEEFRMNKIRIFKPTITENFWGKKVTWEERGTPLTEEEVKLRYK